MSTKVEESGMMNTLLRPVKVSRVNRSCLSILSVLVVGWPLTAAAAPPTPRPAVGPATPGLPNTDDGESMQKSAWNEFENVFTAQLNQVVAGPVAQSLPPVYTHTLHFTIQQTLRGEFEAGQKVSGAHVARQHNEPRFPEGKVCLVGASQARGTLRIVRIEAANPQLVESAELDCSLPLGWKVDDGKPVSPWADLPQIGWNQQDAVAPLRCSRSGRPALMAGPGIQFAVEKVPPAKEIKWTNPDGDGEYRLTVKNTTDQPISVPALLTDGEHILWEESIVILCQGKAYGCPGAKGVLTPVKAVTLQPEQSVSALVNALRLEGPEWPRGGYRIEFQFCLGELSQTESFYYMSRHHDKIRAAVKQP
jgi:hypothetical protein